MGGTDGERAGGGGVLQAAWATAHRAAELPDGPVTLWMVVFSDDGQILGSGQITGPPSYAVCGGELRIDYGQVRVPVTAEGWYASAYIVAVAGELWRPVARVSLSPPQQQVEPGQTMIVVDGAMGLDFTGGPSDPFAGQSHGQ